MYKNHNNALQAIESLIKERYNKAKAVFWGGSLSKNEGTSASDLDLVIVFESLPHAYREAFIYNEYPIDAFINDSETLLYFFEKSKRETGIPGLINMITSGKAVLSNNPFSQKIYDIAQEYLKSGPLELSTSQIDQNRFIFTDTLDDIKWPKNKAEQLGSVIHLFEPLIQFYFRAQKKWSASGKSLIRLLENENPSLALEINQSFEKFFQTNEFDDIERVVKKILDPYGGLLWDGFRSNALPEQKIISKSI